MNKQTLYKAGSIAGFALAVLGLFYLLRNNYLLSTNLAGMSVQLLAVGLMVWARFTFGLRSFHATAHTTTGALITNGAYRWFRHPIYASIIYFIWAGVLSFRVWDAVAAGLVITGGLITRMLLEEIFLRQTYPTYAAYSMQTKRIIPFVF